MAMAGAGISSKMYQFFSSTVVRDVFSLLYSNKKDFKSENGGLVLGKRQLYMA